MNQQHSSRLRTALDTDFFIYQFKTELCTSTRQHEWKSCPCFHVGSSGVVEKARRRNPRMHSYVADSCAEFQQTGACLKGDACPLAHGVFETWLHPSKFCTVMCTDGPACQRNVCWFAHSPGELRVPTPMPAAITAAARMQPAHAAAAGLFASGLQRQRQEGACFAPDGRAACYEACGRPSVLCDPAAAPASSCSGSTTPLSSPTASSSRAAGDAASTAGSCSSSSTVRSTTYLRSSTSSSLQVATPGSDCALPLLHPRTAYLNQHSKVMGSSTGRLPLPQHYGGVSGPYSKPIAMSTVQPPGLYSGHLPSALCAAASAPDSLLQQLQQLQLQQDTVSVSQFALQDSSVWSSMGSSSAASVPASIMPMLSGDNGVLPVYGNLALLSSLEEQVVQAQLQAANAQAAAAAATNNLVAMLAALGVLPGMQHTGVCAGSPPAAALLQQQQQHCWQQALPMVSRRMSSAACHPWSGC